MSVNLEKKQRKLKRRQKTKKKPVSRGGHFCPV
jgi:hypothetical protein